MFAQVERLTQFVQLVDTMRTAQKHYFKTRDRDALIAARVAESAVDKELREIRTPETAK